MTPKKMSRKKSGRTMEFAPGNYDLLEESASTEEKKTGAITRVTRLALDEVDPS
ncbi:MAG: hypothetical protein M1130_07870 [Actinobacteria bacterium]|nr:hypothetical protein [Actinomycetota bacterium]